MCRQTTCKVCGKASWAGCGLHVEQVLGHVPEAERCHCTAADRPPSAIKRLFGRR